MTKRQDMDRSSGGRPGRATRERPGVLGVTCGTDAIRAARAYRQGNNRSTSPEHAGGTPEDRQGARKGSTRMRRSAPPMHLFAPLSLASGCATAAMAVAQACESHGVALQVARSPWCPVPLGVRGPLRRRPSGAFSRDPGPPKTPSGGPRSLSATPPIPAPVIVPARRTESRPEWPIGSSRLACVVCSPR